jgi:hypothetical protein
MHAQKCHSMRTPLILLVGSFITSNVHAQTVHSPANQHWHWLQPERWLREAHPTGTFTRKVAADTLHLNCAEPGKPYTATYHLLRGRLVAITFHFAEDYSYQANWIYDKAEFLGGHQWLDHKYNALITALQEGDTGVAYEVKYEPLTSK